MSALREVVGEEVVALTTEERKHRDRARARVAAKHRADPTWKAGACEDCGDAQYIQGHHEDYDKPLEVLWLCRPCHLRRHGKTLGDGRQYRYSIALSQAVGQKLEALAASQGVPASRIIRQLVEQELSTVLDAVEHGGPGSMFNPDGSMRAIQAAEVPK